MKEVQTNDVLTHHLIAFGNNDLDDILLDYTEESEILTIDGVIKGLGGIRSFFEGMFVEIPTGCEFEMKRKTMTGNVAHIVWSSKSDVADIPLGSDTFVFENGKIKTHTVVVYRR